tara:strand:- start:13395 stop:13598 length:204 start_codon:yes stop_codon:yes gene_type:complete
MSSGGIVPASEHVTGRKSDSLRRHAEYLRTVIIDYDPDSVIFKDFNRRASEAEALAKKLDQDMGVRR